ncbi:hypothetical protein E2C01_096222 [Portunus trituberculatus]|uniref:Uncharacterized protein n=1 Tax=Portunus trituberculatus TaxID=210409 RepID=A0A5B7K6C0_PORTR|nr:hypothetical protein [Portunus trituberculatus]
MGGKGQRGGGTRKSQTSRGNQGPPSDPDILLCSSSLKLEKNRASWYAPSCALAGGSRVGLRAGPRDTGLSTPPAIIPRASMRFL